MQTSIIQKKGLEIWIRPFPENNLQTMKAFYNFRIMIKVTSDISSKKRRLLYSSIEINLASVLNKEFTCLKMVRI